MITYVVGVPGSGKTYFAVYKLWSLFLFKPKQTFLSKFIKPPKPPEYLYAFTNIDGFKFELDERFLKFDFDEFYNNISILYRHKQIDKVSDAELIELAKPMKLFNILFIIDEIHNFFNTKEDPVLVWWLTYHRHLSHDIYLLTQDLSLIGSEYKRIAEKFYRAIDSSKRIFFSKFKYAYYSSYKMNACDRVNSFNINIPFLKEVYDLYHSGQKTKSRSIVLFYIFIAILLIIFVISVFYYVISNLSGDQPTSNQTPQSIQHQPREQLKSQPTTKTLSSASNIETRHTYIYNFSCIDDTCHFANEKYTFPFSYISFIILSNKPLYFYPVSKNSYLTEYFLAFDTPVLDDLVQTSAKFNKKGVSNEESFKTSDPSNSIFK